MKYDNFALINLPYLMCNLFLLFLKGQQGEIKHLYRSFVFIYSKMIIENSGIIVCKSRHIVLAGGGKVLIRLCVMCSNEL